MAWSLGCLLGWQFFMLTAWCALSLTIFISQQSGRVREGGEKKDGEVSSMKLPGRSPSFSYGCLDPGTCSDYDGEVFQW